jgi:MOSC domain-containing protein YiiM
MSGSVFSLQRCPGHRVQMERLDEAAFDLDGMEGDAHRAPGSIRQVLLEDAEVLERLGLEPGTVKENVTLAGVGVNELAVGTRVVLGEVVLEVTKPAGPCSRMDEIRPGLRQELEGCRGVLTKVVTPGLARVGDQVRVEQAELEVAGS